MTGNDPNTDIWERQPDEPNDWYDRFTLFKLLGSGRSLLAAYNVDRDRRGQPKTGSTPPTWRKTQQTWNWKARAEAWDGRSQQQSEKRWVKKQRDGDRRRAEIRDKSWELSLTLIERAKEMLDYPLIQKVSESEDGKTIIFAPAKWTSRDAISYLELADKLSRSATDQETQQDKVLRAIETLVEADMLPDILLESAGTSYQTMMDQMQAAFAALTPDELPEAQS